MSSDSDKPSNCNSRFDIYDWFVGHRLHTASADDEVTITFFSDVVEALVNDLAQLLVEQAKIELSERCDEMPSTRRAEASLMADLQGLDLLGLQDYFTVSNPGLHQFVEGRLDFFDPAINEFVRLYEVSLDGRLEIWDAADAQSQLKDLLPIADHIHAFVGEAVRMAIKAADSNLHPHACDELATQIERGFQAIASNSDPWKTPTDLSHAALRQIRDSRGFDQGAWPSSPANNFHRHGLNQQPVGRIQDRSTFEELVWITDHGCRVTLSAGVWSCSGSLASDDEEFFGLGLGLGPQFDHPLALVDEGMQIWLHLAAEIVHRQPDCEMVTLDFAQFICDVYRREDLLNDPRFEGLRYTIAIRTFGPPIPTYGVIKTVVCGPGDILFLETAGGWLRQDMGWSIEGSPRQLAPHLYRRLFIEYEQQVGHDDDLSRRNRLENIAKATEVARDALHSTGLSMTLANESLPVLEFVEEARFQHGELLPMVQGFWTLNKAATTALCLSDPLKLMDQNGLLHLWLIDSDRRSIGLLQALFT